MKQKAKESDIVFPSDKIGVVEQFLPSSGTTHAEDHEIQASVTGRKYIDTQYYKAKVIPFKKGRANPKKGDIRSINEVLAYGALIKKECNIGKLTYTEGYQQFLDHYLRLAPQHTQYY